MITRRRRRRRKLLLILTVAGRCGGVNGEVIVLGGVVELKSSVMMCTLDHSS